MRRHSMLRGAIGLALVNVYGIFIATYFQPISPTLLAISVLIICLLAYIQLNKRRVLVDTCVRESMVLFMMVIAFQLYFSITAFTVLVYLNMVQNCIDSPVVQLSSLIAGLHTLPLSEVEPLNLSYYYANFFLCMFYVRCFYVMFWRENIIFIFRYLKAHVNSLNQTLLSHLPKIEVTPEIMETICPLCLQNYSQEEDTTKLHCQHIFHLDCIKIWVMKSNCCPLCRRRVVF